MKTQMFALTFVSAFCVAMGTASAQTQAPNAEWQVRVQTLEEQVKQLKAELDALRGQMGATAPAAQQGPAVVPPATALALPQPSTGELQTPTTGSLPVSGAASAGSKIFNPDIGMIGNFVGATGQSRGGSQSHQFHSQRCKRARQASRRSSIRTRVPTSSSRLAKKGSRWRRATSRFRRYPEDCY